ncbi:hypothetical protein GGR52DRAFT_570741 [Hypoxylon sp. FL1284]|nr:hypothetical protein GGR52DRAFT_570741 [Hypoxylon sp. FL1284]
MGLSGPKSRRKLQHDPNNTRWSRDETTFGQKILRAQGWEPGKFLGAQNSSHSHLHTAASSAPIKVILKDDNLGLGAKPREKQSAECTGLDVFKDLLGRLNGKSEESIEKEKQIRSSIKTSLYAERRYGPMRFVSGGLLVGDQMQDLTNTDPKVEKVEDEKPPTILHNIPSHSEKKQKKEKKSKKRKAEDPEPTTSSDGVQLKKRKKRSQDDGSRQELVNSQKAGKSSKKSKKSKKEGSEEAEQASSERKKKREGKKSKLNSEPETEGNITLSVPDVIAAESLESKKERKERRKKEKREKKQKQLEATDSSTDISNPVLAIVSQESGMSTPAGTGTSTPQAFSARHYARSRHIASKRMAMADLQALNQIFMIKPVS